MKQSVLGNFEMTWIPVVGLLLFVSCFVIYTYWTFKKENKKFYEDASALALQDPKQVGEK